MSDSSTGVIFTLLVIFFGLRNASKVPGWIFLLVNALKPTDAKTQALREAADVRQADILKAIQIDGVTPAMCERLEASRDGTAPWIATLTPAELLIARSHGIRPIAAVSATCWMHYGYSWTEGHAQGWETALRRLRIEARVAGANAVVDVKMRTIPIGIENSMDFSLVGTAVKIDGLPPSDDPIIATVPALEFVKLLNANIIPTGIAIGAEFEWMSDWRGSTYGLVWAGNTEVQSLSQLWERVRRQAHAELRASAKRQGNGALAHINFSQMFEREVDKQPKQYLARHIVIATTVDATHVSPLAVQHSREQSYYSGEYALRPAINVPHHIDPALTAPWLERPKVPESPLEFQMVVDLHAGKTPLTGTTLHHQSYASNEAEKAI